MEAGCLNGCTGTAGSVYQKEWVGNEENRLEIIVSIHIFHFNPTFSLDSYRFSSVSKHIRLYPKTVDRFTGNFWQCSWGICFTLFYIVHPQNLARKLKIWVLEDAFPIGYGNLWVVQLAQASVYTAKVGLAGEHSFLMSFTPAFAIHPRKLSLSVKTFDESNMVIPLYHMYPYVIPSFWVYNSFGDEPRAIQKYPSYYRMSCSHSLAEHHQAEWGCLLWGSKM